MIGRKIIRYKTMKLIISMILVMTIVQGVVFAGSSAEMNVLLEMKDTTLQMGAGSQISLVLKNVEGSAEILRFEGMENFEVMSQSQSQSTSNINGDVTKELRVDYMIMPKEVGDFDLQAVLKIDGKTYETNRLSISVEEQDEQLLEVSEDIFLKTTVSKNQLYFGESAVVTYDLYSRYQVDQYGFTEPIESDGFIIEESQNSGGGSSFIMINGNKYAKYTAKQLIINPTDAGEYILPAFNFQVNISTGNFFGETKPVYFKSDEVMFSVQPLPSANKPVNFNGLTGSLSLDYSYSNDVIESNEPITLNVTVSGDGNLYVLDSIAKHMSLEDFSVYETEKSSEAIATEEGQKTKKTYELILIPKKSGMITIPKMELAYFNTDTEKYDNLVIDEKSIEVSAMGDASVINDNKVLSVDNSLREPVVINQVDYGTYGDEYIVVALKRTTVKNTLLFMGILVLAGFSVILMVRNKRKNSNGYLKVLKKSDDERALYELFSKYLHEQHNIRIKSVTADQVSNELTGFNKLEEVLDILNYFNEERYQKTRSLGILKDKIKDIIVNATRF